MNIQCPACDFSAEVPDERIPKEGTTATCPTCKTKFCVNRESEFTFSDKTNEPMMACPNCGINQVVSDNCTNCGIIFSKYISNRVKESPVINKETNNYTTGSQQSAEQPVNTNNARQILGFIGSTTLFVGVFAPIISVPILGNMNYFQNGKGDGVIVLILAIISFGLVLMKKYKELWITGLGSLGVLSYTFISYYLEINKLKTSLNKDLDGNLFAGFANEMADIAMKSFQIQWGLALLVLGCFSIIATAALKVDLSANNSRSIQIDTVSFNEIIKSISNAFINNKKIRYLVIASSIVAILVAILYFSGLLEPNVYKFKITSSNINEISLKVTKSNKITDEDKAIFKSVINKSQIGSNLSTDAPKIEGKTVEQIINEKKQDDLRIKQEEAKALELKKKVEEERKAKQEAFKNLLSAVLVSKINKLKEYDQRWIGLEMVFENKSDKDIQGVKGVLKITDIFDDNIMSINWSFDEGIPAKQRVIEKNSGLEINQFIDRHMKLWNTDFEKLKSNFEVKTIIFKDGSTLESPE